MPQNNRAVGTHYERVAGRYLESKGYKILEYNYRCYKGEVDIITRYADTIVFIEVKYRMNNSKGVPSEAVNKTKRRAISQVAVNYLTTKLQTTDIPCRFDVISILDNDIIHYENAFDFEP